MLFLCHFILGFFFFQFTFEEEQQQSSCRGSPDLAKFCGLWYRAVRLFSTACFITFWNSHFGVFSCLQSKLHFTLSAQTVWDRKIFSPFWLLQTSLRGYVSLKSLKSSNFFLSFFPPRVCMCVRFFGLLLVFCVFLWSKYARSVDRKKKKKKG